MKKISIYLFFVAIWVLASVAVAAFPGIMTPVAGALMLPLNEVVALFLSLMVVLTMIFLVFIGREAGRSVAEYLL
ncbi:MAG TPA: hypothetical protein PKK74_01370 [Candidatus Methanoculleus thermohydrogenotrophicum]|jgi:hypothetical protein|nr:hypothetical protein [Candidatus Methanoculleus thermohydrogenotrophicum]NLM81228.1 hypothetical protein [Candidatus Methanoculleus thermohydrogenotrophicum]HOB17335.1 hypothetical protein [Candidatus Methanoculleus thermohydrogenotrophicum]HPZ37490.1 hypothetical protein [Candidatus Methanoculleus thermohydrogenotrophicum]HQC90942.1 hypothetical protein [Candidatus Methanoculleus thermohydrogenotrophicum]